MNFKYLIFKTGLNKDNELLTKHKDSSAYYEILCELLFYTWNKISCDVLYKCSLLM